MIVRIILFAVLTFAFFSLPVFAYPTSLNNIPVADMLEAGGLALQIESDGSPHFLSNEREVYLMTQVGLTDTLEVGLDLYDFENNSKWQLNAKWLALQETDTSPALAVGVFDAARGGLFSNWYVTTAKDVGPVRFHAGYLKMKDKAQRGMLGAEYALSEDLYLLTDWQTGPDAYHTLGLYKDVTDAIGLTAYYAENNSARSDNFIGFNICWTARWKETLEDSEE